MTNVIKDQFKENLHKITQTFLARSDPNPVQWFHIPDPTRPKNSGSDRMDDNIGTGVIGFGTVHTHGNGTRGSDCNCLETTPVYLPSWIYLPLRTALREATFSIKKSAMLVIMLRPTSGPPRRLFSSATLERRGPTLPPWRTAGRRRRRTASRRRLPRTSRDGVTRFWMLEDFLTLLERESELPSWIFYLPEAYLTHFSYLSEVLKCTCAFSLLTPFGAKSTDYINFPLLRYNLFYSLLSSDGYLLSKEVPIII